VYLYPTIRTENPQALLIPFIPNHPFSSQEKKQKNKES
jgi:hypothetical protein